VNYSVVVVFTYLHV